MKRLTKAILEMNNHPGGQASSLKSGDKAQRERSSLFARFNQNKSGGPPNNPAKAQAQKNRVKSVIEPKKI